MEKSDANPNSFSAQDPFQRCCRRRRQGVDTTVLYWPEPSHSFCWGSRALMQAPPTSRASHKVLGGYSPPEGAGGGKAPSSHAQMSASVHAQEARSGKGPLGPSGPKNTLGSEGPSQPWPSANGRLRMSETAVELRPVSTVASTEGGLRVLCFLLCRALGYLGATFS